MDTILDKIIAHKRIELEETKRAHPLEKIKEKLNDVGRADVTFFNALSNKRRVNIIAEVKKGSPSKGIICHDFDPIRIAKDYEDAGASAISVLTDEHFFYGKLDYLCDIRRAVRLPLLRKDFIIDEYQIYEARSAGADAILLIAAVLDGDTMREFLKIAHKLGMDVLVEVHNKEELDKALTTDARIIGINNRNLKDFSIDLNITKKLAKYIPNEKVKVSESGINTREDIDFLLECGVNTFLIGESLVRGESISGKMKELCAT